jgi:hypothetical protein
MLGFATTSEKAFKAHLAGEEESRMLKHRDLLYHGTQKVEPVELQKA